MRWLGWQWRQEKGTAAYGQGTAARMGYKRSERWGWLHRSLLLPGTAHSPPAAKGERLREHDEQQHSEAP